MTSDAKNKVSFDGTLAEVARRVRSFGTEETEPVDMMLGFVGGKEYEKALSHLLDKRVRVTIEVIEE